MGDLSILAALVERERGADQDPRALAALEEDYERLCDGSAAFLMQRNRFRVGHAAAMRLRKPRLLFGRDSCAPGNFHTPPLLECADVVFLSIIGSPATALDQRSINPSEQTIADVVARLPAGFMPDLYFDYQVCMSTVHPRGLECAPFPTFANLCHQFYALRCEALARVFDFVLPVSSTFSRLMAAAIDPAKIIDVPFGLAWGSFDYLLYGDPDGPRDIDVLLSFGGGNTQAAVQRQSGELVNTAYGPYRERCVRLFEMAKAKLGHRYNFVCATGLPARDYYDLVRRSRISLNAVGINGPYNYRSCETLNLGAMLMQYEPSFATGPQGMADYLSAGESYVPFDEYDFLPKLEALLADAARTRAIARQGQAEIRERYNLRRLFREFLAAALAIPRQEWQARRPSSDTAALNRVEAYLLDNRREQRPSDNPTAIASQALAVMDLGGAVAASGLHPVAFLMPLYKALRSSLEPGILEGIVGPGKADLRLDPVEFYDRALAALPALSVIDRFNHLVLCAEEGRVVETEVVRLFDDLETAPRFDSLDIARIVAAIPCVEHTKLAYVGEAVIRNIGHLMAGADQVRRSAVAVDFMRFWLCLLLARSEHGSMWLTEAEDILARYPMVEEPAAVPLSKVA